MVIENHSHQKLDTQIIRAVLDEAVSRDDVKATGFRALYAMGQLIMEKAPGDPITMGELTKRSGVSERTLQGAIVSLRKLLLIDYQETPKGYVFEFLEPIPPVDEPEPQPWFRGRNFCHKEDTDTEEVEVEEEKVVVPVVLHTSLVSTTSLGKRAGLFSTDVLGLAETFKAYVTPLGNKVNAKRYRSFVNAARFLVKKYPVAEIYETVAFVFESWEGVLPFKDRFGKQKVTSLWQIANSYTKIRMVMRAGFDPDDSEPRKVNFMEPLENADIESQVQDLTQRFREFRLLVGDQYINDHRIAGWSKTFRIMLWKDERPYVDIKTLLDALTYCRDRVEADRYHNAYAVRVEFDSLNDHFPKLHRALEARNAGDAA